MQATKKFALMAVAGLLVGGGGVLAMRHVAGQVLTAADVPAPERGGEPGQLAAMPPPAPELLPDGMPAGPVITPDALQTPPTLPSGPRADGSVDADGTPGFVPTQPAGAMPDGMGQGMMMNRPVTPAPQADTSSSTPGQPGLDPKGFDPVPSR